MKEKDKSKAQLIIELAKLRAKVYDLEDESLNKAKLNKMIKELELKLNERSSSNAYLNKTIQNTILNNFEELNDLLNEFDLTNKKEVLKKAQIKIDENIKNIKKMTQK